MKISNSFKVRAAIGLGMSLCLMLLPAATPIASADVQSDAPAIASASARPASLSSATANPRPAAPSPTKPAPAASDCQKQEQGQQCPAEDSTGTSGRHLPDWVAYVILALIVLGCVAFWRKGRTPRKTGTRFRRLLTVREETQVRTFARSLKKRSDLVAVLLEEGHRWMSPLNTVSKQPELDEDETPSTAKFDEIYDGYYPDEDEQM